MRACYDTACSPSPRGLCASLLNKSSIFITADERLRRTLRLLPDAPEHCHSERHVLIQGAAGVGKRTLALHCWRMMQAPVLLTEKCHLIHSSAQLRKCLREAHNGDLLLNDIDQLPPVLLAELPVLLAKNRPVRVVATTTQVTPLPALRNFLSLYVPPLAHRHGDTFALAKFLLRHRLQQDTSSRLLHTILQRRTFVRTNDLYIFLVSLCFVAARLGKNQLDHTVVSETLSLSDEEQFENYFTYLAGSSSLCELVADYGLKDTCQLLERVCISNALTATRHNITLAGKLLRVPTTTLFNKIRAITSDALSKPR